MRVAIVGFLVLAGHMFAADCACTGKGDAEMRGGNGMPLN